MLGHVVGPREAQRRGNEAESEENDEFHDLISGTILGKLYCDMEVYTIHA